MSKPRDLPSVGTSRERDVLEFEARGRTKLRQDIEAGRFPAPMKLSERLVVFNNAELHSYYADPLGWIAQNAKKRAEVQP